MAKQKQTVAEGILQGAREALAVAEGKAEPARVYEVHVPDEIDVKAIREAAGMSQKAFALSFGFSLATVRDWEQKRRRPEGPARAYLKVIAHEREAVARALAAA